ncbi:MAG: hypothetical protein M3R63_03505 [Actinomycetota bacterium]|nr:hypothetical protein [Actinomycetota bacterium]
MAYLVRTGDEEDDLRSPIGFEDDADVMDAALARITQARKGGKNSGARTT